LPSGTRGSASTADAGSRAGTEGTSTSPAPSLPLDSRLLPERELRVPGRLPVPIDPDSDAADTDDIDPAEKADGPEEDDGPENAGRPPETGEPGTDAGDDGPDAAVAGAGASPQTVQ
jgi:hypothetical protein